MHVSGERTFSGDITRYYLATTFYVRRDILPGFAAQIKLRLLLTDRSGSELPARTAFARRKKITKHWWNHQWHSRQMAVRSFLADGSGQIVIGEEPDEQVVLSSTTIQGTVGSAINEKFLNSLRRQIRRDQAAERELEEYDNMTEDSDDDEDGEDIYPF